MIDPSITLSPLRAELKHRPPPSGKLPREGRGWFAGGFECDRPIGLLDVLDLAEQKRGQTYA
jgi:hypothetical protein